MPPIKPIKRKELIHYLKKLGFTGPFSGGKHQFMQKDDLTLTIPNPHINDITKIFLLRILKQANIKIEEWLNL